MTEMNKTQPSNIPFTEPNLDFIPLGISENRAGNYDNYLRITLFHIQKIKKYMSKKSLQSHVQNEKNLDEFLKENKKILLLDLDETLIHADFLEYPAENEDLKNSYDAIISFYTIEEQTNNNIPNSNDNTDNNTTDDESKDDSSEKILNKVGIFLRPKVKEFLQEISQFFLIGIFTASIPEYADAVINYLDPEEKYVKFKLYRNDCVSVCDMLRVKDLSLFGEENLDRIVLLDNNIYSFSAQLSNGILINSFFCDKSDDELSNVRKYLMQYILPSDDVRKVNEQFFAFETILNNFVK